MILKIHTAFLTGIMIFVVRNQRKLVNYLCLLKITLLTFQEGHFLNYHCSIKVYTILIVVQIRFHYYPWGPHNAGLALMLVEMQPHQNKTTKLSWFYGSRGEKWIREEKILPNVTHR